MKYCAIKAYDWSGGIAQFIVDLNIRWGEWLASLLCDFTPGEKSLQYPLNRTLDGSKAANSRNTYMVM
jgi:hypothetical protein